MPIATKDENQDFFDDIDSMPNKKIGVRELKRIHKEHWGDNPPPQFNFENLFGENKEE